MSRFRQGKVEKALLLLAVDGNKVPILQLALGNHHSALAVHNVVNDNNNKSRNQSKAKQKQKNSKNDNSNNTVNEY